MNINLHNLANRILFLHSEIDTAFGTIANYPRECDEDFYHKLHCDRSAFNELARLAEMPVEPPLYWQSMQHFIELYNLEASDATNARHQANIKPVERWLEDLQQIAQADQNEELATINLGSNPAPRNDIALPLSIQHLTTHIHTQLWIECTAESLCQALYATAKQFSERRSLGAIALSVDSFINDSLDEMGEEAEDQLLKQIMLSAHQSCIWEVLFYPKVV